MISAVATQQGFASRGPTKLALLVSRSHYIFFMCVGADVEMENSRAFRRGNSKRAQSAQKPASQPIVVENFTAPNHRKLKGKSRRNEWFIHAPSTHCGDMPIWGQLQSSDSSSYRYPSFFLALYSLIIQEMQHHTSNFYTHCRSECFLNWSNNNESLEKFDSL